MCKKTKEGKKGKNTVIRKGSELSGGTKAGRSRPDSARRLTMIRRFESAICPAWREQNKKFMGDKYQKAKG